MLKVYSNGRGGKHRDTAEAARWRFTTAQIADAMIETGWVRLRSFALMHAEDEMARATRLINWNLKEATGL